MLPSINLQYPKRVLFEVDNICYKGALDKANVEQVNINFLYWIVPNTHRYAVSGLCTYVDLQHVSTCCGHHQGGSECERERH